MAFKMKGFPYSGKLPIKNYADTRKYKAFEGGHKAGSVLKQKIYTHEDMYEVEEQMSYIQEDLEEDPNNKELLKKLKELTEKRDKIHTELKKKKGGNIKPGYTEGERDVSKDEPY